MSSPLYLFLSRLLPHSHSPSPVTLDPTSDPKPQISNPPRFAADREANTRVYGVARKRRNGGSGLHFESVASELIRVGDIVLVRHDQEVPADLVLLSTSSNGPICYLETSNLDGESDLKVQSSGLGFVIGIRRKRPQPTVTCAPMAIYPKASNQIKSNPKP